MFLCNQGYLFLSFEGIKVYIVISLEYRPDESAFVKLDSSLKKNTAFVRKLVSDKVSLFWDIECTHYVASANFESQILKCTLHLQYILY